MTGKNPTNKLLLCFVKTNKCLCMWPHTHSKVISQYQLKKHDISKRGVVLVEHQQCVPSHTAPVYKIAGAWVPLGRYAKVLDQMVATEQVKEVIRYSSECVV